MKSFPLCTSERIKLLARANDIHVHRLRANLMPPHNTLGWLVFWLAGAPDSFGEQDPAGVDKPSRRCRDGVRKHRSDTD